MRAKLAPTLRRIATAGVLAALTREFHDQRALVDLIVRREWLLRRIAIIEARFWVGRALRAPPARPPIR
jgi:hypothetical protein